jgi:hypothetical protein
MKITKINDNTIQVEKEEITESVNTFTYDELLFQRNIITNQIKDFTDRKQKELNEIDLLIAEADNLGIKP